MNRTISIFSFLGLKKRSGAMMIMLAILVAFAACVYFLFVRYPTTGEMVSENGQIKEKSSDISLLTQKVLYVEMFDSNNTIIGSASGFLINDEKTLVTNFHVVEDAYKLKAYTSDGNTYFEAVSIIAYDEKNDLAVLQLNKDTGISPMILGRSDNLLQGDSVYAIGYPLGLANTISDGIVSSIYTDNEGVEVIQITAPISHGSSGGALVNKDCEVIGVTCGSYDGGQNLNVAIPSNTLSNLMKHSTKACPIKDFYRSRPHIKTVQYVLDNKDALDNTEVLFGGYISSAVLCNIGGETWQDYTIVNTPYDITNCTIYINSEDDFGRKDYQYYYGNSGVENERSEAYSAIGVETYLDSHIFYPGDYIFVKGIVDDVHFQDPSRDIDWHHIVIRELSVSADGIYFWKQ